jgi:chromosome segregation ATPase
MDERKKQIEELEKHKRENLAALDGLWERLGEALLGRMDDAAPADGEAGEYRRLQKAIDDSKAGIATIEEQVRRFRELEENIARKEQEDGVQSKELAGVYARLGKLLLEDPAYGGLAAPYREQADALVSKVRSLETRIGDLDQKEGSNVFSWIGKNAQTLVLRSFLTKAQDNLEQLYRSAGERYSRADSVSADSSPALAGLNAEVENIRGRARLLSEELSSLRAARRKIGDGFGADGNPHKQIQVLKNHIEQARDELKVLYRRFGAEAAEARGFGASLINGDDSVVLDDAARVSQSIRDDERAVEKLRASLAIDEEAAKIEKNHAQIREKRAKIAEAENDIAEYEKNISQAERNIAELQKQI